MDLSILTSTRVGTYMGRTIELWVELGHAELLARALGGDGKAIRQCYNLIRKSKK